MEPSLTARAVASDGAAVAKFSANPLHPREWAMLQTGLTNAQRVALLVVVSAYTGFQLRNGKFYIVESRVAPYLSTSYRTFKNYVTDLRHLGLMDLLSRSPNQYGKRSIWCMRLDVIRSNGQLAMSLGMDDAVVEDEGQDSVEEPDMPTSAEQDDSESSGDEGVSEVSATTAGPVTAGRRRKRSKEEHERAVNLEAERLIALERPVVIIQNEVEDSIVRSEAIGRELTIREAAEAAKEAAEAAQAARRGVDGGKRKVVSMESVFVRTLNGVLAEYGRPSLTTEERVRAVSLEDLWRRRHGGDIPLTVVATAGKMAELKATRTFVGFMLKVISDDMEDYAKRGPDGGSRLIGERREPKGESRY